MKMHNVRIVKLENDLFGIFDESTGGRFEPALQYSKGEVVEWFEINVDAETTKRAFEALENLEIGFTHSFLTKGDAK